MLQIACKYEAGHQKCCKLHAKRRGWGIIWGPIPWEGGPATRNTEAYLYIYRTNPTSNENYDCKINKYDSYTHSKIASSPCFNAGPAFHAAPAAIHSPGPQPRWPRWGTAGAAAHAAEIPGLRGVAGGWGVDGGWVRWWKDKWHLGVTLKFHDVSCHLVRKLVMRKDIEQLEKMFNEEQIAMYSAK